MWCPKPGTARDRPEELDQSDGAAVALVCLQAGLIEQTAGRVRCQPCSSAAAPPRRLPHTTSWAVIAMCAHTQSTLAEACQTNPLRGASGERLTGA